MRHTNTFSDKRALLRRGAALLLILAAAFLPALRGKDNKKTENECTGKEAAI